MVPEEFLYQLRKAKREREFNADMIKDYTKKWVEAQKKYVELSEAIDKLKGEE